MASEANTDRITAYPAEDQLTVYLLHADRSLKIFSIFDDLKYDRSDADLLSPPMRRHAVAELGKLGYKQTSGSVLTHSETKVRCIFPKFHALGSSPFDILRYTQRNPEDYVLLTPTQTACQFIDAYPHEDALARIKRLVLHQPINLLRLMDYLDKTPSHAAFQNAIGHLKFVQREAIESEPLRRRRALC